ncbi:xanthine dehydrogenase family protein molybdopterin-binding subunit [Haloechinothrix sp. YIM 98757]|uniref:Xanthine dehydrogenase family protein molybdopterin-binding subunit n=1 Tax=Haloechinothrix aidingensis TaxID=2752311 RepID=A0A838AC12_9PSEU|nr:molybdopterin cofactor-binding domain-containing protein [Haloechinothrix aidingensis]MBA0126802.1 xanthine dehydrogenase family protein molybdopterin-binding subunit [Haloechinothrix aidingensis]
MAKHSANARHARDGNRPNKPGAGDTDSTSAGSEGFAGGLASVGGHLADRRRFLGYLLAAPTVVAAAQLGGSLLGSQSAGAAQPVPSNPQVADNYDLSDAIYDAAKPTSDLITVQVHSDGTVSHEMVRTEVGQGVQTAIAMLIAEEMDIPIEKVNVTHAPARPELVWNQLTGGSTAIGSQFTPVRVAAAIAKGRLLDAAAAKWDLAKSELTAHAGRVLRPSGQALSFGELAEAAAVTENKKVSTELKPDSDFKVIGKPQRRVDAMDIVTGQKEFATDMEMPDALPTMVCRPPTINGTVKSVNNADEVQNMPGVTDVATITTGVAVRAKTFGQCVDAIHALDVSWNGGPVEGTSDTSIEKELKDAHPPWVIPGTPGTKAFEREYTFAFTNNAPLEPATAIADVKEDSAEIWAAAKLPITAQGEIASLLGLPATAVTFNVVGSGGSFGRRLFNDGPLDAAEASQKMGKPVRLMWHRADEYRHGRGRPMQVSKIRAFHDGEVVHSLENRYTSVFTDFGHGFGDLMAQYYTSVNPDTPLATNPGSALALSQTIFELTAVWPYSMGPTKQLLMEVRQPTESTGTEHNLTTFNTTAMRQVYNPNVVAAQELFVDELANEMGRDRYEFRREFAKDDKFREVIEKVAEAGNWGRSLPDGVAQGIGVHEEYKQHAACLVEVDCRPETVNRKIPGGTTGPRVLRVVFVSTVARHLVNPLGAEAQLQGGIMDGISLAQTNSLHLKDGAFLEGSYDDFRYTRQWNVPTDVQVILLPEDSEAEVGGFGEVGVAPTCAAVACAIGAARGSYPNYLPISHNAGIPFEVKPHDPPIPQSPTNGLEHYPAPAKASEETSLNP